MRLASGPIYTRKAFPPPSSHPPTRPDPDAPHLLPTDAPQHPTVTRSASQPFCVARRANGCKSNLFSLVVVVWTCWLHICVLFFHLLLRTVARTFTFMTLFSSWLCAHRVIVLSVYRLLLPLVINAVHPPLQEEKTPDLLTAVQRFSLSARPLLLSTSQDSHHAFFLLL